MIFAFRPRHVCETVQHLPIKHCISEARHISLNSSCDILTVDALGAIFVLAPVQLCRDHKIIAIPSEFLDGLTQEFFGPTSSVSLGLKPRAPDRISGLWSSRRIECCAPCSPNRKS